MAATTSPETELPASQGPHESASAVVWRLAWPAVALNSLQVVNTLLDRRFIGHLPADALVAHGASLNVLFLMFSLAVSLATGATALVSRAYGAEDMEEVRRASRQSLALTGWFGLIAAFATFLIAPGVAQALLPASEVRAHAEMVQFLRAYAFGLPAIYLVQTLAGSMRGVGDTKSPMWISGIQILVHILLNLVLINRPSEFQALGMTVHVPGMALGLYGAGIALSTSAWVAAIGYVGYARFTRIGAQRPFALPDFSYAARVMRIAIPAGVMSVLRVLSMTAFTLALSLLPNGGPAIAAMSVAFSIESVMFMPAFGLSVAAGALVGQSLGMERPDRAERLATVAAWHSAFVTLVLCAPVFLYAPNIAASLLGEKPEIIASCVTLLRYLCVTEIFFCVAMVLIGAMQGAGDTTRPMWISIISLWILRVPLAFLLALPTGNVLAAGISLPWGAGLGDHGAWLAMSFSQMIQGILAIILFKQGAWKFKKV